MLDMPLQDRGTEESGAVARWPLLPPDPWAAPVSPAPVDYAVVPNTGAGVAGGGGNPARSAEARPGGGPRDTPHRSRTTRLLDIAAVGATAYWNYLLTTLAVAIAIPLLFGWYPATVTSDSMRPLIDPGDVVVFDRYDGAPLGPGSIIQFDDPVRPGQTITHRVVEVTPAGAYVTKGDGNQSADSSLVYSDDIIGVAAMVSPNTGLPSYWWSTGKHPQFVLWAAVTAAAALVVQWRRRRESGAPIWPRVVVGCMVAAALGGVAVAARTSAAFAATTATEGNSFSASASFSGFSHLGVAGTAECAAGTSSTVTLTAAVPAGHTVLVAVSLADITASASPSASDSAGNTYAVYASSQNGSDSGAVLLGANAVSALSAGDQITIVHPAADSVSVSVHDLSGVAATGPVAATDATTGMGNTPSATVTTAETGTYVLGLVAIQDQNATIAAPTSTAWTELANGPVKCSAKSEVTSALYAVPLDGAGSLVFNPTLSKQKRWSAVAVALRD